MCFNYNAIETIRTISTSQEEKDAEKFIAALKNIRDNLFKITITNNEQPSFSIRLRNFEA